MVGHDPAATRRVDLGPQHVATAHGAAGDLEVAAEAADGDQALALVRANDYDVAMLDMSMPGRGGIELISGAPVYRLRDMLLPLVRLDERGAELLCRVGGTAVQVTLSHTETTAMAVAVVLALGWGVHRSVTTQRA